MKSFETGKVTGRAFGITLYAEPGWGKTTLAAHASDVRIIMCGQETGYLTLLSRDLVPDVPRAHVKSWAEFKSVCREIYDAKEPGKVLAIDSLSELERLCHDFVMSRDFNDNAKAFDSYGRGYKVAMQEIAKAVQMFSKLKEKGVSVLLIGHSTVKTVQNPITGDVDQVLMDVHKNTMGMINEWSDAFLFGQFESDMQKDDETGRQIVRSTKRVLHCAQSPSHVAKNRLGLPDRIEMPDDPANMWSAFRSAIINAKREVK